MFEAATLLRQVKPVLYVNHIVHHEAKHECCGYIKYRMLFDEHRRQYDCDTQYKRTALDIFFILEVAAVHNRKMYTE